MLLISAKSILMYLFTGIQFSEQFAPKNKVILLKNGGMLMGVIEITLSSANFPLCNFKMLKSGRHTLCQVSGIFIVIFGKGCEWTKENIFRNFRFASMHKIKWAVVETIDFAAPVGEGTGWKVLVPIFLEFADKNFQSSGNDTMDAFSLSIGLRVISARIYLFDI